MTGTTLRLFARVLRVLSILVALQLSGGADLGRTLGWFGDDTDCCDTCPNDADGKRCPPECPKCHCSTARAAALPARAGVTIATVDPRANDVPCSPEGTEAPRAPYRSTIYRPPRSGVRPI